VGCREGLSLAAVLDRLLAALAPAAVVNLDFHAAPVASHWTDKELLGESLVSSLRGALLYFCGLGRSPSWGSGDNCLFSACATRDG